ncbi:MAG: S8 family serine peptidase, partial [Alphaproteobacteria bacterium]|nr:S8 family serine peptidase [Alphaproteobacteria bacterium]
MAELRVAILDSGFALPAIAACAFVPRADGGVDMAEAENDRFGHGSAVAAIIAGLAPGAKLLNGQIFGPAGGTSAAAAAAGLDWACGEGADIVTMSFGLRANRGILHASVAKTAAVMLGASPARGDPVYPSAYAPVLRITGDARCAAGEISHLATEQADFGACVRGPGGDGASMAVAHAAGLLAA